MEREDSGRRSKIFQNVACGVKILIVYRVSRTILIVFGPRNSHYGFSQIDILYCYKQRANCNSTIITDIWSNNSTIITDIWSNNSKPLIRSLISKFINRNNNDI